MKEDRPLMERALEEALVGATSSFAGRLCGSASSDGSGGGSFRRRWVAARAFRVEAAA